MTNKRLTLIALVITIILIIAASDIGFILFEDGSFIIDGCLPWQLCS
jgi:hypothetical protein